MWVDDEVHLARTVILAMGAEHKKIGVPGEEELGGRGVSYCATCDAAFFKGKNTVIVGGGDSAMEEAIFLAKFADKVTIVNRRDEFRASKIMLERARAVDNIEWLTPYVVDQFAGCDDALPTVHLRHVDTGEELVLENAGTFIAIGHEPQSMLVDEPDRDRRRGLRRDRRAARPAPTCPAYSRPATSSTTPTARRSPRRAAAVRRRSTPSGTCATHRRSRRPHRWRTSATWPRRNGPPRPSPSRPTYFRLM